MDEANFAEAPVLRKIVMEMPPIGERLYFRRFERDYPTAATVLANERRTADGFRLGDALIIDGSPASRRYLEWMPVPSPNDPRWIPGAPQVLRYDFEEEKNPTHVRHNSGFALCAYPTSSDPQIPAYGWDWLTADALPFPGFMGGPHRRYQGCVAFIPGSVLADDWRLLPDELVSFQAPFQAEQILEKRAALRLGTQIGLCLVNDSGFYRQHFELLVHGMPVTERRFRVTLQNWLDTLKSEDDAKRAGYLRAWCVHLVYRWAEANQEMWLDDERASWNTKREAFSHAADYVLDYYGRARVDWLRIQAREAA